MIDPVDATIFGFYTLAFLGLFIVGGAIEWLFSKLSETLEAFAEFSGEGRL